MTAVTTRDSRSKTDDRKVLAILTDLGVPGVSVRAIAKKHGVSFRTVYRILEKNRTSVDNQKVANQKVEDSELAAELQRAAQGQISNWVELCEPAIAEGVAFLRRAIRTLKPDRVADVRVVSEAIVETLSNVASTWRKLDLDASKAKPTATQDNTSLTTLPDDDLLAEAARISSSPSSEPN